MAPYLFGFHKVGHGRKEKTTPPHLRWTPPQILRYADPNLDSNEEFGAGEGARTLDPDLGKVVLYH